MGNILNSCRLWFGEGYWVNYNMVEAVPWLAKAAVILPGLVWHREIWKLHIITLFTSALLIWVSERKLLPTMVAFKYAVDRIIERGHCAQHSLSASCVLKPSLIRLRFIARDAPQGKVSRR